jgi:glutathione S-transferase
VSGGPPVLWQYSFSNYNEKVRWALDYKGIPHRRRSVLPMGPRSLWFSRGDGTLPVLELDRERIVDSTAIIAALEKSQPGPPLYPGDPDERRRALELEEFFDEHAGHDMRRVGIIEWWDEPEFGTAIFTIDQPAGVRWGVRSVERLVRPFVWRFFNRRYGFEAGSLERSKETLRSALDRIEAERNGSRYLVGDSFTVADLSAAALLYPFVWPSEYPYELPARPGSEFLDSLRDHPACVWIANVWRRHRGDSAEI